MSLPLCGWVEVHAGIALEPLGPPPDVGLALRARGTRPHLLVSTVLGRHIPVRPCVAIDAAREAASAVVAQAPDIGLVVGFAETATALSAVVAEAAGVPWLHSARVVADAAIAVVEFDESHSHATRHLLCPASSALLRRPGTVVLVDDELSTGATAMSLVRELDRLRGGRPHVIATLLDARGPAARESVRALADDLGCRVHVVARRVATVRGDLAARMRTPGPPAAGDERHEPGRRGDVRWVDGGWPAFLPSGGRYGAVEPAGASSAATARLTERVVRALLDSGWHLSAGVHVLGSEESAAVPLAVAHGVERSLPVPVVISATTRSPARVVDDPDYPVRSALRFDAFEQGTHGERFAYNVGDDRPAVLLVDETCDAAALAASGGVLDALAARCPAVLVVRVDGAPARPPALFGPDFSTYHRRDVE